MHLWTQPSLRIIRYAAASTATFTVPGRLAGPSPARIHADDLILMPAALPSGTGRFRLKNGWFSTG